jgi:hypothetical protein
LMQASMKVRESRKERALSASVAVRAHGFINEHKMEES